MSAHAIELPLGTCTLVAVPAIHCSVAFAAWVNAACRDPRTRPDAIAVELPPGVTAEIAAWLRELGAGPGRSFALPAMLAIATGVEADAVPGALTQSVPLSSTDSITEAIRCAIELDLPLVGVDLDGRFAPRPKLDRLLEDPLAALDLPDWVRRNAGYSHALRFATQDDDRDRTMAAGLAHMAQRGYRRIMVTCGVGHWRALTALLAQYPDGIAPPPQPKGPPLNLVRALLHPSIASGCIDRFPAMAAAYERNRRRADEPPSSAVPFDASFVYTELMEDVYREHFSAPRVEAADVAGRPRMETLVERLLALGPRRVPAFTDLMDSATGMSPEFQRRLSEALLKATWASTRDRRYSSLPVLTKPDTPGDVEQGAGEWERATEHEGGLDHSMALSWPPTDRLTVALSLAAIRVARHEGAERRVEPFSTSLLDGLALRETMRAFARGTTDLQVFERRRTRQPSTRPDDEWEPVVWIFREATHHRAGWVIMAEELEEILEGTGNRPLANELTARGTVLVEQIGFGRHTGGMFGSANAPSPAYVWDGYLAFQPFYFTLAMTAAWLARTRGRVNPIASYRSPTSMGSQRLHAGHAVAKHYQSAHGVDLQLNQWATSMIRMAIPYATRGVTVIAPDRYILPAVAAREARARNISVNVVPHSFFNARSLREISEWHVVVPLAGSRGARFPASTERMLGPATGNIELLPPRWRNYGGRPG